MAWELLLSVAYGMLLLLQFSYEVAYCKQFLPMPRTVIFSSILEKYMQLLQDYRQYLLLQDITDLFCSNFGRL